LSNWGRCKQLLVVGKDVMLNMMCVEDDDDIILHFCHNALTT